MYSKIKHKKMKEIKTLVIFAALLVVCQKSFAQNENVRFLQFNIGNKFDAGGKLFPHSSYGLAVGSTLFRQSMGISLGMNIHDNLFYKTFVDSVSKYEEIKMSSLEACINFNTRWGKSRLFAGPIMGFISGYGFEKDNDEFAKNPGYTGIFLQFNLNWPQALGLNKNVDSGEKFLNGIFIQPAYYVTYNMHGESKVRFLGGLKFGVLIRMK